MAEGRVDRRLAAILAADVAGYSRLMGADEAGTLARFNLLLDEVARPAIDAHRGRLVKTMGDGFLVEFGSVVDAVQCAADIQGGVTPGQATEPDDRRMLFRIGIHLGDVLVEGDDIHGDGVNIAARLEGLAEPGGVCVSDMVHAGVRNKLSLGFTDLGEQSLKNIAEPVQVFHVVLAGAATEGRNTPDAIFRRPSVAVLPFENLSGDPEQEYFADGLTEDIITALSLWRSFPVIARNSTFAYKGLSPDIRKVGEELGARYVIEGSVRKSANRVRVTAQLINTETGHHVWAERFDRDLADIFDLQDELTQRIAATVAPEVERFEHKKATEPKPQDLNAWEILHRGMAHLYEFTLEGNVLAREMFGRVLDFDPSYVDAHVGIAWSYIRDLHFGIPESGRKAMASGKRAVELDRSDSSAHLVVGIAHALMGEHDQAINEMELAVELNPNLANGHVTIGHSLALIGRGDEAIGHLEKGLSLNPKDPRNHLFYSFMARAHLSVRNYEEAARWGQRAVNWNANSPMARKILTASLAHLGRVEEAHAQLDACEHIQPGYLASPQYWHPYKFPEDREHFLEGLRKAGWEG